MTEALLLALALAMDAFAVALTQGAKFRPGARGGLAIAATFGLFQALMPLAGWIIGAVALIYVEAIDHWIAFGLLTFLGVRMLGGHVGEEEAS
ncbi:MAG: manganese efflux pump MntP family protein, partial [Erythrobacter sp.]